VNPIEQTKKPAISKNLLLRRTAVNPTTAEKPTIKGAPRERPTRLQRGEKRSKKKLLGGKEREGKKLSQEWSEV